MVNQQTNVYRSGLGDGAVRFSVNLKGGPAMKLPQFMKWRQTRLLGVSFLAQFPSGQYEPSRLINIGNNRWAFHPRWAIRSGGATGSWMCMEACGSSPRTPNSSPRNASFPGTRRQTQEPIGVLEGHLGYDFKPGVWVSADGNFWYGGRTSLNGIQNPDTLQRNSRIGGTAAIRVSKHQSVKFSYAREAVIRFGGKYQALAFAWQYAWVSRPQNE